ncbi:MAG: glycosyltransferase [Terrimesophilobacter sp.]
MHSETVRPHLLYVAWGFPPSRGGGVYRALATANAFSEAGWRVTVLTVERETFLFTTGIDASLESHIDPSVRVVRIPYDVASIQHDLRRWSWIRARFTELWNVVRVARNLSSFPEPASGAWRHTLESVALSIHDDDPVDLVVGTTNPFIDFAPGLALKKKRGVPYVMDYRDAWQLNVFTGARTKKPWSNVARWERALVKSAHEIWFVNEPIKQWHADLYPHSAKRMRVVMNGFDRRLAHFSDRVRDRRDEGLVFGYIGTISPEVPMRQLLAGWKLAREESQLIAESRLQIFGYLGHTGQLASELTQLLESQAQHGVSYDGPVEKSEIVATYATFDALLLVIGPGNYVTSGKVFEYAASGIPIVSIHDQRSGASRVLTGHPAWVSAADLTARGVADALLVGAALALEQTREQRAHVQVWAEHLARENQLRPRIEALASVVHTQNPAGSAQT